MEAGNRVYIVMVGHPYEGGEVAAVFSTRELAEAYAARSVSEPTWKKNRSGDWVHKSGEWISVEVSEVDKCAK